MTDNAWQHILDNDETILWQGRPSPRIVISLSSIGVAVFGLFFAGFALFWMVMAAQAGGAFWMFGLIHFTVGLVMAIGAFVWPAFKRRYTWYTLTDRRAFIATNLPIKSRKLAYYPITPDTPIDYRDAALPSIFFASRTKRTKNGTRDIPVGFELIADAPAVQKLIRQIQQGAT